MARRHSSRQPTHRRSRFGTAAAVIGVLGALLAFAAPSASASYPGGDGRIAFVSSNQIYTVSSAGTGLTQLTTGGKNYRPHWSPNGNRIAYVHETSTGSKDIWVMSAAGGAKTQVTHLGAVTEPTWSPDGKWLAFGAGSGGYTDLTKIRSTAPFGGLTKLGGTYSGCAGCDPNYVDDAIDVDRFLAWSPDGDTIAVYDHVDGQFDDTIYMYSLSTQDASQYSAVGADCCGYANWSDLAFGPAGQFGFADVELDDTNSNPQPSQVIYPGYVGRAGDTGPAPDPANTRIAVTNSSSGTAKIYVQQIGGANRQLLTNGYQPDWQPRP